MKKILLLSLAVMFLCWSLAMAANSGQLTTSGKPTAGVVQKTVPVSPQDKEAQIAKAHNTVTNVGPAVGEQEPATIEKPAPVKEIPVDNSNLITNQRPAQENTQSVIEKQSKLNVSDLIANKRPIKQESGVTPPPANPQVILQGGDDFGTATVISSLPYTDNGTTVGYTYNYDLSCLYENYLSPDVVYSYAPAADGAITVSLCGSGYDTGLGIYQDNVSTEVACNDDYCDLQSEVDGVTVLAGHTYYIVVSGYNGGSGDYIINVSEFTECVVTCPDPNTPEGEPDCYDEYVDVTNGGCNSSPYVFGAISDGETICGTSGTYLYTGYNYRDTDWFLFDVADRSTATITCVAQFPLQLLWISGTCDGGYTIDASTTALACSTGTISLVVNPGTYMVWVGPSVFVGVPCGSPYYVTATLSEPPPPPTPDYTVTAPGSWSDPSQNTCGAVDNCNLRVGEDQIWEIVIPSDGIWTFSLCNSSVIWDSYIYLGSYICDDDLGYNDDGCGTSYGPGIITSYLTAGTYYLTVEGFSETDCGEYALDVTVCDLTCPTPNTPEGEPDCYDEYVDATNGGCNSTPNVFGAISDGETICGTAGTYLFAGSQYRDTDWFLLDVPDRSTVTLTGSGEFAFQLLLISGTCTSYTIETSTSGGPCAVISCSTVLNAGTYMVWAGPSVFTGVPCGSPYYVTAALSEPPPPPTPDFSVTAPGSWTDGNTCGALNNCDLRPSEEQIWEIVVPNDGVWTFSLCNTTPTWDTYLYLGTISCESDIAYNDDFCGLVSEITATISAGTYYLTVEGFSSTYCGAYQLDVTYLPPCVECPPEAYPEGEPDCGPGYVDNYNAGCNDTINYPFQDVADGDVICGTSGNYDTGSRDTDWYRLTTTEGRILHLKTFASFPMQILIIDGNAGCPVTTYVLATAAACDTAELSWTMPAGIYWFWVGPSVFTGYPCPQDYVAWIWTEAPPPPPANDACADAEPVNEVEDLPWSTISATPDNLGTCITSNDIWYLYTATVAGPVDISLCGSSFDTKLAVYDGPDCPPGPPTPVPYQGGEDIASAVAITDALPVIYTGTTAGYVNDYDEVCTYSSTSPDVVYSYSPASDDVVSIYLCGSSYDTKLFVYDNSYTPGAPYACNDDAFWCNDGLNNDPYKSVLFDLAFVAGHTYYIVVDGYNGASGDYQISLTSQNQVTTLIECNDDFCGVQSQVTIDAEIGHQYLIQVGGFSDNSGDGVLTIAPPPPDPCANAVYNNGDIGAVPNSYASQCDPVYPFAAGLADDFVLDADATISGVVCYIGFWNHDPISTPANLTGMMITIYNDAGGIPGGTPTDGDPNCAHTGDIVTSQFVTPDNFVYSEQQTGVWQVVSTIDSVNLVAGTTYWLEIAPVLPDFNNFGQSGLIQTDVATGSVALIYFPLLNYYWVNPWTPGINVAFCLTRPAPALSYSPSSFSMTCDQSQSVSEDLYIRNSGSLDLTYELFVDQSAWMLLSSISGSLAPGEADTIVFTADASTLGEGTYNGTITLNSNDPANPTVGIPVEFVVTPGGGPCDYVVGDANGNGTFNGLDVTYSVAYFKGGPPPPYECDCPPHGTWYVAGDVNGSCSFNGLDVTYMVAYFKGGPLPHACADCLPNRLGILLAPKAPVTPQPQSGAGQ